MGTILKLLSGASGGWLLAGGLVVALLAGGAGGYAARGVIDAPVIARLKTDIALADGRTAQCKATAEAGRANGNQKVIDALNGGVVNLTAALDTLNAAEAARKAGDAKFLKELSNAPHTTICGTSPAERAYRDSLRPQPGTAPAP